MAWYGMCIFTKFCRLDFAGFGFGSAILKTAACVWPSKANAETPFLLPSRPFPILAFAGVRDWGSSFPVPYPRIRQFLEMAC